MALDLTEKARERVRYLRTQPESTGEWLRIGVRGGGCSGLSYVLDWSAVPGPADKVFEFGEGVKVVVDKKSWIFVNGIVVDFEEGLLKTGFVFNNPNAVSSCSCGESFSV